MAKAFPEANERNGERAGKQPEPYAAITGLDETVLNRLINRILIGEPKKVDGVKTQKVRIVYNFVGEL